MVWECRLPVKVQASRMAIEETTDLPDEPGEEALGLEGVE
jgi:hypothetical protein